MATGPPPSRLVLIKDLVNCQQFEKVRFLGCVDYYDISSGTLALRHDLLNSPLTVVADVNIDPVLGTIKREDLEVGVWINVMGSIEKSQRATSPKGRGDASLRRNKPAAHVRVQAIAIWSAEGVDPNAYTAAVELRQNVQ